MKMIFLEFQNKYKKNKNIKNKFFFLIKYLFYYIYIYIIKNNMNINNYPQCESKVNWMKQNWKSNPYYAQQGVDGSEASIRRYLGNIEKFCPPPQVQKPIDLKNGEYTLTGGKDNKYCADEGNRVICNRNAIGPWEKFKLEKQNDGRYALRGGKDNKYCADEGNRVICNRTAIGPWEKFKLEKQNNGTYALRGGKGNKYCADEGNRVICNRNAIGPWEKFKISALNKQTKDSKHVILYDALTL